MRGDNMKYAVIENGKVVNLVISDADYAAQQQWVLADENVQIGFDFINGAFVDNRPAQEVVQIDPPTKEELLAQLEAIQKQILAL
jgi:hypothetical protein